MTKPVTLTVVLKPAHGGAPPPEGATAQTLARQAPDPDDAERVRQWFSEHGFEVAPVQGGSFAITAPLEHVAATIAEPPATGELSLRNLPPEIALRLTAIAAEPPLDFGPTSW
jgi:hypothetical protein